MFAKLKATALSAVIGLGALAAVPAAAQADSLYLNFGGHDDARFGIYFRDGDRHDYRRHDHRRARVCTAARALNKAERLGLRRARVVDIDRRTIDVVGRKHGDRIRVTFARAPNCPVVRW